MKLMSLFRPSEKKQSQTYRAILAAFGLDPAWTKPDYKNITEAGYKNCMTVYSCINLIAKSCAGIPWILTRLQKGGTEERVDKHPLVDIMKRPNPQEGQGVFIEKVIAYFLLAGNTYIEAVGPERKEPQELYSLRPDRMTIKKGSWPQLISGYEYKVQGNKIEFAPENILHIKTFNPLDDYYGLSPVEAAAKGVDVLNMSMQWNYRLLQNDMKPPGAFKIEQTLSEEQFKRLSETIKQRYQGYESAGKPLLLEGGVEWQSLSMNPRDLDWLNSEKVTMRKICAVFNVPSELMGDSENKTYSNIREARRGLYTETVLPLLDLFRDELNNWLTPKFGENLRLDYDRNAVEALSEEMSEVFIRMTNAWWLTINERRKACGEDELKIPEADQIWVPMMLTPIGGRSKDGGQKSMKARSLKVRSFWQEGSRKRALWDNFFMRVKMKEKTAERKVLEYLDGQAERLKTAFGKFSSIHELELPGIFDVEAEEKRYIEEMKNTYLNAFVLAGEAGMVTSKGELYIPETKQFPEQFVYSDILRDQIMKIVAGAAKTICGITASKIILAIKEAIAENWTYEELTQQMVGKYPELGSWLFSPARARTIAATEMAGIENLGQLEGYRQSPFVERKGWLCSFVPDSRDAHMAADHEYSQNPILLDEPFMVDNEPLDFPGDPAGSPGNIINCYCTTYPHVEEIT